MKRTLFFVIASLAFVTTLFGQSSQKPPVYIAPDDVRSISQVVDVTSKDDYFLHLKALIESHKVKNLTNQYKYNGSSNLRSADLSYISSNGQIAMIAVAKDRGILASKYKAEFGQSCETPSEKNGSFTEQEVVDHLKCRFALIEMKNSTPNNIVTKGRFAMLLNQALNLWIRKLDALK